MIACPPRVYMSAIVIGAGVAGLQCARSLLDDFGLHDVLILEACHRVGGCVSLLSPTNQKLISEPVCGRVCGCLRRRVWGDRSVFPGVELCLGAEIVHGDNTVITRLGAKEGWEFTRAFTWAQGDGGPSEHESPDGGAGYYYIGTEKRYVGAAEEGKWQEGGPADPAHPHAGPPFGLALHEFCVADCVCDMIVCPRVCAGMCVCASLCRLQRDVWCA